MAKKLRSYSVLSCTLAVLTTVAFILACGEGQVIEIAQGVMQDSEGHAKDRYSSVLANMPSYTPPQSSSEEEQPPAGVSSSSEELSLSSWEQPSSASLPSSSSDVPSSASESLYFITCNVTVSTGVAYVNIPGPNRPEVKCIERANTGNVRVVDQSYIDWNDAPSWFAPSPNVYDNIYAVVQVEAPFCQREKAKCEGTITITAASSSSRASVPSSSSVYVPPTTQSSSAYVPPTTTSSSSTPSGGACGSDGKGDKCLWNGAGDCWPIKDQADRTNCGKNAWLYQGGTEGSGALCKGGTFICGKDSSPPTGSTPSLGCCKWDTETKCWDVYTEKEKTDCSGGSNKFWSSKCPGTEGACPSN